MAVSDAAADERLRLTTGIAAPREGPARPARWGAPSPRQSSAAGEAADRRAGVAFLTVRRLGVCARQSATGE
eukprot:11161920-Lingulodinium_polyedra.AAC.1